MEQVEAVVAMFVLVVIGGDSGGDGDSDVLNFLLCCCCCWVLLLLLFVFRCREPNSCLVKQNQIQTLDLKDLVLDDGVLLVDFIMYIVFIVIITVMKYL